MPAVEKLFAAIDSADAGAVKAALEAGADPNAVDLEGRSALHRVAIAQRWCSEVVAVLADGGADPLTPDATGLTPLHYLFAVKPKGATLRLAA